MKYRICKGKAISTRKGIINELEEIDESLLDRNAEKLLNVKIIEKIEEDNTETSSQQENNTISEEENKEKKYSKNMGAKKN
ncbi:hypothetical protein Bint_1522 [Brachyspira intermedia PWS/A]|uniref:Uncharacterized protein n=1 Tax=Brachyspira intermedia (strain ATCC 51140 / PWS/A) TaxID=1045858 RepID=G0EQP0_BRAIP|nr:hypothetical protein [Brachyspira intermedia]AEM22141.1 hypothetical protein Bint_1522 [Brachyspira intermedia PWS/A]